MSRYLIITIGIGVILLMLLMWGYLFLYGAPKQTTEVFSNLGVITKGTDTIRTIETLPQKEGSRLSLGDRQLEQLTTRAVAGYGVLPGEDGLLRYVERGTGHVYEIDLKNSFETQVSLTTLPQTVEAIFSPLGTRVALTVFEGYVRSVSVGLFDIQDKSLSFTKLPLGAANVTFKDEDTIFFSLTSTAETVGYSFDLTTGTQKELFRAPFADAHVTWNGEKPLASPKPSRFFDGALYEVSGKNLTPKTLTTKGFVGFLYGDYMIVSGAEGESYTTTALMGSERFTQGALLLREKCAHEEVTGATLWCAAPLTASASYLEDWYKGIITSEDYLWQIDLPSGSAELIADLRELSGRTLDASFVRMDTKKTQLFFVNKPDQSLWTYKLSN